MRCLRYIVILALAASGRAAAQGTEPVISKDAISIHTVQRGNMQLQDRAFGLISSLNPPLARVAIPPTDGANPPCRLQQNVSALIAQTRISGNVVGLDANQCVVGFSAALPESVAVGQRLEGVSIDAGVLENVVFFDRPGDAVGNSDGSVFVVDLETRFAHRVQVHYGRLSGPRIQVISGLAPGDRVIVTDMSRWKDSARVRLE